MLLENDGFLTELTKVSATHVLRIALAPPSLPLLESFFFFPGDRLMLWTW